MGTRHITLNEWQLLPEDWALAVAGMYGHPSASIRGRGVGSLVAFTIVSPVIVHLRVCRFSMMISPAKGQKSLDMLHSTGWKGEGGRGGGREGKRKRKKERENSHLPRSIIETLAYNLSQKQ